MERKTGFRISNLLSNDAYIYEVDETQNDCVLRLIESGVGKTRTYLGHQTHKKEVLDNG